MPRQPELMGLEVERNLNRKNKHIGEGCETDFFSVLLLLMSKDMLASRLGRTEQDLQM